MTAHRERILIEVDSERLCQERLKSEGRFRFTCADNELANAEKLVILVEEIGEVARQVLTQEKDCLAYDTIGTRDDLRKELIQVAAIVIAWVEGLARESVDRACAASERAATL